MVSNLARVKPLEWGTRSLFGDHTANGPQVPCADSIIGRFRVNSLMIGSPAVEQWFFVLNDSYHGPYPNEPRAAAAAQDYYETLILYALEPAA